MRGDSAITELADTTASGPAVPWTTIPAMLADNLVRHAGRTAVVDGDTRISYAELSQWMHQVAAGLHARHLGPGDVVALWAPNSWQWVVSLVACWWRGCTVVPIPARGRVLDALPILQATRARLLFTCSAASSGNLPSLMASHLRDTDATLREVCPHLQAIVDVSGEDHPSVPGLADYVQFAGMGRGAAPVPGAQVSDEDIYAILFTSGSTGSPKGVPRQHAQVLRNRWATSQLHGYSEADRLLVVSEFSHALGLHGNLLRSLLLGATLVIAHSRNPAEIAALMRAEHITAMGAPPSLFAGLLREKIGAKSACSDLRLALTGAANIPPALVRDMIAAGIGTVISAYGMTECDTISSTGLSDSTEVIATTVGRLEAGQEVQITDEGGSPVPPGVEGEVWIRGYAVTSCYLGAGGQTEPAIDAQGWLHSGDIGCFTAEGYLQILGRKKDVITIHGYTLYPAEIETLLSQSGLLKEIAVIGMPHAVAGELCVAFIVPADPAAFSLKRLRLWARTHVADYKVPGRFVIVDHLPLNRNGKVDRLSLKSSLGT
jgi:acyl-CoA synthetase (AMP-forming)/AMP-acid ligase II